MGIDDVDDSSDLLNDQGAIERQVARAFGDFVFAQQCALTVQASPASEKKGALFRVVARELVENGAAEMARCVAATQEELGIPPLKVKPNAMITKEMHDAQKHEAIMTEVTKYARRTGRSDVVEAIKKALERAPAED